MGKEQFLRVLRRQLRSLPADERERILSYYREMIEDRVEGGEPEQDAVRELGDVRAVAQKILAENPNRRPRGVGKFIAVSVLSLFGVVLVACIALAVMGFRSFQPQNAYGFVGTVGNQSGSPDFVYKTYTADSTGIGALQINAENKAIEILPSDSPKISVEYATNSRERYDFSNSGGTFSVRNRTQGETGYRNWSGWHWDDTPRITVRLPKNFGGDISVNTTNGYIRSNGFAGIKTLDCQTTNSGIDISDLSAEKVTFQTENAAINLDGVSAASSLTAKTQNAVINFKKISSANILLDTQNALISGSINGKEDDYTVDARTTNAVSNLSNRSGGKKKLSVYTSNAIINVKFEG